MTPAGGPKPVKRFEISRDSGRGTALSPPNGSARKEREMDRHMRKALRSRARYDWETHEATRRRNAEQIAELPAPQYPATGTARIGALIAEVRRRRDEALLSGTGAGAGGLRSGQPLDNRIVSSPTTVETPQPAPTA